MSSIQVTQQFIPLHKEFRRDLKEAFGTLETKLDIATADHYDFTRNGRDERELLEQSIESTKIHLSMLKRRVNTFVPINRLPVELLIYIILFAHSPKKPKTHPYLSFSWVCVHWRSVLIQTPDFWTFVRYGLQNTPSLPTTPFDRELLRRSKSAQLDIQFRFHSGSFAATFEHFLAQESHRIRNLWIIAYEECGHIFSCKHFPSLRGFVYDQGAYTRSLPEILPILNACDCLDTFQCTLGSSIFPDVVKNLAPILSRIRRLNIGECQDSMLPTVLDMLHNNGNLEDFKIVAEDQEQSPTNLSRQINLPGLQFLSVDNTLLLQHFHIPRLSSLVTHSYSSPAIQIVQRVLKNFDLASIRYLYILDPHHEQNMSRGYSILGSKERRHFESLFSTEVEYFVNERFSADPAGNFYLSREIFSIDDFISDICPRDCFELKFDDEHYKLFAAVMKQMVSSTLPRLTHLTELYVFSSILVFTKGIRLERFLSRLPSSIEKIIMKSILGDNLTDLFRLLSNPLLCPRLQHLSSNGSVCTPQLEDLDRYAEYIGRTLTECLQSRYKVHGDKLRHVALGNCPPLPDAWLKEIQKLGTKVVTTKDASAVIIMNSDS